jgi:hypothetical protein
MAMCEKCGKSGYVPYQMSIDPTEQKFVGPCCAGQTVGAHLVQGPPAPVRLLQAVQPDDVEYGVEVSSKVGVRAYANYHGLQLSFERTPTQIKQWAQEQGIIEARVG